MIEYKETDIDFMLQFLRAHMNVIIRKSIFIQQGTYEIHTGIYIEPAFMTTFLVDSNITTLSMQMWYEPKKQLILTGWCMADCNLHAGEIIARVVPVTMAFERLNFKKLSTP